MQRVTHPHFNILIENNLVKEMLCSSHVMAHTKIHNNFLEVLVYRLNYLLEISKKSLDINTLDWIFDSCKYKVTSSLELVNLSITIEEQEHCYKVIPNYPEILEVSNESQ